MSAHSCFLTCCSADRGQSHVVGVALMLGIAVMALGTLTVGIGTLVDSQATNADADRVADDLDRAVQGAERTGQYSHPVHFSEGSLQTESRTLRILENGSVIQSYDVDAVVYENDDHRVTATAGAVIHDNGDSASLVSEPPITDSRENEVLVVGAPVLNASRSSVGGQGGVTATIETDVSHSRTDLGTGQYAAAIETETPDPFERHFEDREVTTDVREFGDDSRDSVVATFPETRQAYVTVHDLQLEVTTSG